MTRKPYLHKVQANENLTNIYPTNNESRGKPLDSWWKFYDLLVFAASKPKSIQIIDLSRTHVPDLRRREKSGQNRC